MSVVIRTERLVLRSLDSEAAQAVLAGAPPPGVSWADGYPMKGTREAAALVAAGEDRPRWVDPFVSFQIIRRSDGHVIGDCGFRAPPDSDGVVEVRYEFARSAGARGFEAEALEALIGFAFTRDEVVSVRAGVDVLDTASRRVLERAGMMAIAEEAGRVYFEA